MKRFMIAALLVLFSCTSLGSEFYVSPSGDDRNPGTRVKPFRTLERARDAVREMKKSGQITRVRLPFG